MLAISPLKFNCNHNIQPNLKPRLPELKQDTVSFSGGSTIHRHFEASYEKDINKLNDLAVKYFNTLETVALKLEKDGIKFAREYSEQSPIKSAEAFVSKVRRSGSIYVPDRIRATMYVKNPYDLSNLTKIFNEMKTHGFILAEDKTLGKPDLDVRLEDTDVILGNLPKELHQCLGKPQKSGYEDIQIRFINEKLKGQSKHIPHELIILFGPNYAIAKGLESMHVYNNTRKFGEMHIVEDKTEIGTHTMKARRYIDLIKSRFNAMVSKKLFENAKNIDYYGFTEDVPIKFDKEDTQLLKNYFNSLNERIASHYDGKARRIKEDKAADRRLELRNNEKNKKEDLEILAEIREGLSSTVDFFNLIHMK